VTVLKVFYLLLVDVLTSLSVAVTQKLTSLIFEENWKMASYQVRLINKKEDLDTTVEIDEDTTILEGAEEAGIELPFSCHSGSCSSCVGKIVEGEVNQDDQVFLDDEQMGKGFALLCVTYPRSNCTIKTHQEPYLA
jgi:2Fe-2S type ferredoxin